MAPVSLGGGSFGLTGALFLAILDGRAVAAQSGDPAALPWYPTLIFVVPYHDFRGSPTLIFVVALAAKSSTIL